MEKFIGLDLGTTTIGIATSDVLGIVHGRENFKFERGNYKKARNHVLEFASREKINNIVIGLPLQIDGQEGERAYSVRRFVDDLKIENENLVFYFHDERFSTIEAKSRLDSFNLKVSKEKKMIDMVSAVVILEHFLGEKYGIK